MGTPVGTGEPAARCGAGGSLRPPSRCPGGEGGQRGFAPRQCPRVGVGSRWGEHTGPPPTPFVPLDVGGGSSCGYWVLGMGRFGILSGSAGRRRGVPSAGLLQLSTCTRRRWLGVRAGSSEEVAPFQPFGIWESVVPRETQIV